MAGPQERSQLLVTEAHVCARKLRAHALVPSPAAAPADHGNPMDHSRPRVQEDSLIFFGQGEFAAFADGSLATALASARRFDDH